MFSNSSDRRARWRMALVALSVAALAACGGERGGGGGGGDAGAGGGGDRRLSIATGGTSGVYFVYGGGLASVLSKNIPGVTATAEATSASVDNMLLIDGKKSALAFTLADTATDAVKGTASFKEPVEARALGQLYTNYTQVVALADSGITTVEGLKGKKVSLGAPGSGTEVIALRLLETAGLDPKKDISPAGLSIAESVAAIRDGSIDAFFWSGGLPTAGITDLSTTKKITMIPTEKYLSGMQEKFGTAYQMDVIPGGTYKGAEQDVQVIGVPNLLVVNADMDEELAYQITKTMFEQKDALVAVHPEAKNLDPKRAQQTGDVELHPGARRYFDEAGK
jgi:TRAP transporter TAXI family solute receptor